MPGNFPKIGVAAVVQGAAQYQTALQQMVSQTNAAGQGIKGAATNVGAMDQSLQGAANTLKQFVPQIGQAQSAITNLGPAFGMTGAQIAEIAIPIGVAIAALAAFFALAERGAGFSDIENGFAHLTAAAGVTADTLLSQLHTASQGTIDDIQLMTISNNALLGVNAELQKSFGQDLPQMMQIARTIALATGQDTVSVFDRITEAIKRGQTRGLAAIGIIVDQKKAYDDYAKSMDISVKSMTKADQEQALLNATLAAGKQVTDELGNAQESNATKMQQIGTTITNIFDDLSKAIQPIFGAILDQINTIVTVIGDAISSISPYIEAIANLITGGMSNMVSGGQKAADTIKNVKTAMEIVAQDISTLAKNFFEGGARALGALAGGITYAANTYIFPAVIGIANFIADFLSGLSPPPLGPLHNIDQGGANVMLAWMEGFTGVSLEPVKQVAADVNAAMGTVASMSLEQVKSKLLALDDAIAPFQEQLDLVKNHFDDITAVTKPALDAIDRQIALAQSALARGSTTAADQIKALDAQKQALTDYADQQQIVVDNAEIQLGLAKLQQSAQRDALLTQQAMLQQAASLTTKQPVAKAPPKPKGGKGAAPGTDGGGVPDLTPTPDQQTAAQQAGIDLQQSYQEGFTGAAGDTGSAMFAANESQLKAAGNRISGAVGNIGAQLDKALVQPFKDKVADIGKALNGLFDGGPNSIQVFLGKLPGAFADFGANLETNLVGPFGDKVQEVVQFLLPGNPKSIWTKLANFASTDLPAALATLGANIDASLVQPFITKIQNLIGSVWDFLNGDESNPNTLPGVFHQVMTFLGGLPDKAAGALKALGTSLIKTFVDPIIDALNGVLTGISTFINQVISTINTAIAIYNQARTIIPGGGPAVTPIFAVSSFTHIPYPTIAGAASGGMFGGGLLRVGERGPELIGSASPIGVFPAQFVTAIDRLTSILTRPTGANYTNTYNSSQQSITFNGVEGAQDAVRKFAFLQAVSGY